MEGIYSRFSQYCECFHAWLFLRRRRRLQLTSHRFTEDINKIKSNQSKIVINICFNTPFNGACCACVTLELKKKHWISSPPSNSSSSSHPICDMGWIYELELHYSVGASAIAIEKLFDLNIWMCCTSFNITEFLRQFVKRPARLCVHMICYVCSVAEWLRLRRVVLLLLLIAWFWFITNKILHFAFVLLLLAWFTFLFISFVVNCTSTHTHVAYSSRASFPYKWFWDVQSLDLHLSTELIIHIQRLNYFFTVWPSRSL